jgi:uncharacterized membrane protein
MSVAARRFCWIVVACTASGSIDAAALATPLRYVATDLGDLPGGSDVSFGHGLNNSGQVVGGSYAADAFLGPGGGVHPFLWAPDSPNGVTGRMIDLGSPDGQTRYEAWANGINDSGHVIVDAPRTSAQVFLWTPMAGPGPAGAYTPVGDPPAPYHSRSGRSINNYGQIAGVADQGILPSQAFVWTPAVANATSGQLTNLGDLPQGFREPMAQVVNNAGQVTGAARVGMTTFHATLWTPSAANAPTGTLTDIGVPEGYESTNALGMNDAGQVVGRAWGRSKGPTAYVWTPAVGGGASGSMSLLTTPLATEGTAADINNAGDVVGWVYGNEGLRSQYAFVRTSGDRVRDLNGLLTRPLPDGRRLTDAVAVNDHGQILAVADYWVGAGLPHAFLLTPVPESGTGLTLSAALALFLRRRRPAAV